MTISEFLQEGQLSAAIEAARQQATRPQATVADQLTLCDLLFLSAQFTNWQTALEAIRDDSPAMVRYLQGYRELKEAIACRNRFFSQGIRPGEADDPPKHVRLRRQAVEWMNKGKAIKALASIDRAEMHTPEVEGHLDGREFFTIRDGDDRLASIAELIVGPDYLWFGWEEIRRIRFEPFNGLRDQHYRPAMVEFHDQSQTEALIPLLYPLSEIHPDPQMQLGLATDWASESEGPIVGLGLRMLNIGDEEISFRELTQLDIRPGDESGRG